ncbi:MAG: DUF432 domain-containing protein [Halobacteriota archaeon]|nr:DUF432 domain-containing protein [Halobacteriota archaeon]
MTIEEDDLFISVMRDNNNLIYNRTCANEDVEKIILADNERLILNPIEPLNKPKELTPNLLIEFEKEVLIDPEAKRKIYLKFPIEIGVFLSSNKKNHEIIDILTLSKKKYTLYGSMTKGLICKYWKSDIYTSVPSTNPIYEGVIELNIENKTTYWVNVTKVIFNAYSMKIYYDDNMVSMKGKMEIIAPHIAETSIINSPIKKGMNKSIEYFTTRKIPVVMTKFVMEAGL